MQNRYHDRMPNPDNFTPQRPIRVDNETWDAYGAAVGERKRSEDLKAYIEWRLRNPTADLNAVPPTRSHRLFVVVDEFPDGRRSAQVLSLDQGSPGRGLRDEIERAIVEHFNQPEAGESPTRKGTR